MSKKKKQKWWNMLLQRIDKKGNPNWELAEQTALKQREQRIRRQFKANATDGTTK